MHNTIASHLLLDAQPILEQWWASPSFHTLYDVFWYGMSLWPLWVSCHGCAPSQPLVHLFAGRAREARKSLAWTKHCPAEETLRLQINKMFFRTLCLYLLQSWCILPRCMLRLQDIYFLCLLILYCHKIWSLYNHWQLESQSSRMQQICIIRRTVHM